MPKTKNSIKSIVLDFDGVLTNNRVYLDENGLESVVCNRSDGLAIESIKKLNINIMIISSEKNKVVKARAKKLNIKCFIGVADKKAKLEEMQNNGYINLLTTLYVGNDINDFHAMKICKYSCCPRDSHPMIVNIASFKLKTCGGDGVVREIVEKYLKIDILKVLYS